MRTVYLLLSAIVIGFSLSCNDDSENAETTNQIEKQNENSSNAVINTSLIISVKELNRLSVEEKRVANLLNAAISGLQSVSYGGEFSNYTAQILFSKDRNDRFSNLVFIAPREKHPQKKFSKTSSCSGSCEVTGLRSGIKCAKEIAGSLSECGTLSATIEKTEDGVKISWEKE